MRVIPHGFSYHSTKLNEGRNMAKRKAGIDPTKAVTYVTKNTATGETFINTITGKSKYGALLELNKKNKAADGKFVSWLV